jgi:hypothetical protein
MAGNTTNFNIAYPTSTDYVKDGATAIQTVATGFDGRFGDIATYPNQLVNVVSSVSRPIPYAMSAGTISLNGTSVANNGSASTSVAFVRSTRFTDNPIVSVTQASLPANTGSLIPKCTSVASTGFTIALYNVSGSTISWTGALLHYIAVQMTSANSTNT